MKKTLLSLLGAIALGASALPSAAAPLDAPIVPAVFHADGTDARVSTVQYRQDEMRRAPPPRHHRHHRHHRRHSRPHLYRGH